MMGAPRLLLVRLKRTSQHTHTLLFFIQGVVPAFRHWVRPEGSYGQPRLELDNVSLYTHAHVKEREE